MERRKDGRKEEMIEGMKKRGPLVAYLCLFFSLLCLTPSDQHVDPP